MWKRSPIIKTLSTLLLFIVLVGASLFLIAKDSLFQRVKINGALMYVKGSISNIASDIRYFTALKEVNRVLVEENAELMNQIERLSAKTDELDSAYIHLDSTGSNPLYTFIPAKIVSNSTNKLQNYLILNRGKKDGVKKDMGVISSKGVVGIVTEVTDNYSYVVSFLSTTQSISAKIEPSGAFGPLAWEGVKTNFATLSEIPHHININEGDTVYTSGYSAIFPKDIPLGIARESVLKRGTHQSIKVELFQEFNTLHFVNIVVNNNREELTTFNN